MGISHILHLFRKIIYKWAIVHSYGKHCQKVDHPISSGTLHPEHPEETQVFLVRFSERWKIADSFSIVHVSGCCDPVPTLWIYYFQQPGAIEKLDTRKYVANIIKTASWKHCSASF